MDKLGEQQKQVHLSFLLKYTQYKDIQTYLLTSFFNNAYLPSAMLLKQHSGLK